LESSVTLESLKKSFIQAHEKRRAADEEINEIRQEIARIVSEWQYLDQTFGGQDATPTEPTKAPSTITIDLNALRKTLGVFLVRAVVAVVMFALIWLAMSLLESKKANSTTASCPAAGYRPVIPPLPEIFPEPDKYDIPEMPPMPDEYEIDASSTLPAVVMHEVCTNESCKRNDNHRGVLLRRLVRR